MTDDRTDTMQIAKDCVFCAIIAGHIPADIVARSDRAIAFRDIDPQAPLHVLVVPTEHYGDVAQLAAAEAGLLAEVIALADRVAGEQADGQFRLVFNSGPNAGQSVFHVHGHVLGGAHLHGGFA